jgi:uroporphyrinogen decarboxylase
VLPPSQFERWCVAPVRAIAAALKGEFPGLPLLGFPRGVGASYIGFAAAAGLDGVSIDWTVPAAWARDNLQAETTVQGNLDPQFLVAGGAAMEREIHHILETLSGGPHIFNLGHGIVPQTPPEHVARLAEIVRGAGSG